MLKVFGLPASAEPDLRLWYDSFERALANFTHDPAISRQAQANVEELNRLLQARIDAARGSHADDLLGRVVSDRSDAALSDAHLWSSVVCASAWKAADNSSTVSSREPCASRRRRRLSRTAAITGTFNRSNASGRR
jgi:hypothetical protein